MKLTRHIGRSGKRGVYNPKHNDRRFDLENSEHIDTERARQNVFWDCYNGYTTMEVREDETAQIDSFEDIERAYYVEHYSNAVQTQNARNEANRHPERDRTIEDVLKSDKTCPEETVYQIGTMEQSVSADTLLAVVQDFTSQFEQRFGAHVHILNWALHLDESTPHIHERHVFDCENRYGEIFPQQEKALEELGIPLPNPDKPKGKSNNRKMTFDAVCRTMLFDIVLEHGLHLDKEPEYGGRAYLEKQDFILEKQKERLAFQETQLSQKSEQLESLTMKIEQVDRLIDEVSETAYEKAVDVVTDTVCAETQKEDVAIVQRYQQWVTAPERPFSKEIKEAIGKCLEVAQSRIKKSAQKVISKVLQVLKKHDAKQKSVERVKATAKEYIMSILARENGEAAQANRERQERRLHQSTRSFSGEER